MKMMLVTLAILLFQASESVVTAHAEHGHPSALPGRVTPDHVILFVLEGIDQPAIESGRMPVSITSRKKGWRPMPRRPSIRLASCRP